MAPDLADSRLAGTYPIPKNARTRIRRYFSNKLLKQNPSYSGTPFTFHAGALPTFADAKCGTPLFTLELFPHRMLVLTITQCTYPRHKDTKTQGHKDHFDFHLHSR